MTMKVGWDENKYVLYLFRLQSTRVKKVLEEYVDIYRQYSSREDKEDFRLFVAGVASKISNCLEENYSVMLAWL